MLTLQGGGVYGHNGKVYRKTPGTVFLFDHYETRDWLLAPHITVESTGLWIHFTNEPRKWFTYNTVTLHPKGRTIREISKRIHTSELTRLLMEAWDLHTMFPDEPVYWQRLKSLVTTTILEVLSVARKTPPPNQQQQVVTLICQYIDTHFSEQLNLELLAHLAGYSPFFFLRLFRKQTGRSPKEYIDSVRLEKAKELLSEGFTVSATAQAVGLESPYSFSRFFKRQMKVAPQIWVSQNPSKPKRS